MDHMVVFSNQIKCLTLYLAVENKAMEAHCPIAVLECIICKLTNDYKSI